MINIDLTKATDTSYKPSLYDVHRVLEEEVVGEQESRMSLFTNWILSERDVMMAGQRSSGKTFITDHVRSFVGELEKSPRGQSLVLSSGSEKSAWYEADKLNKAKYIVVLELNKLPTEMKEVLKDWGEGKDSTYKTTIMSGGTRLTKSITLKRKPFVFCLADEQEMNVDAQLSARLTVIRTDNSITQNKNIMKHQAMLARLPTNPLKVDEEVKQKLVYHITTLPILDKYLWKNPAAELFIDSVPPFFTDCRRDFPKYLENAAGICRFYWKERLTMKINGDKEAYFITPQDMWLNHIIYGKTIINSALKCNNIEREMMGILQSADIPLKRVDVQKELKRRGMTLSSSMIARHLNTLVDLGYLEKDNVEGNKKVLQYTIGKMFEEFSFYIDWKTIIDYAYNSMRKLYPDIAEEYYKRYCKVPLVNHPFTNEVINLLEVKQEIIKTTLGKLEQFNNNNIKETIDTPEVGEEFI